MDQVPAFNRVSIRAVLVNEGEDAHAALAAAGLVDPVAIPVLVGDDHDLGGGILGDGITPNLTAVLETEDDGEDAAVGAEPSKSASASAETRPSIPVTDTMPAAYGMQPLAPVRRFN